MPFMEQMANVGGEVERALKRRAAGESDGCRLAFERALELLDLTLAANSGGGHARELARIREALSDYFCGDNAYGSSDEIWRRYFGPFALASRRGT